MSKHAVIDSYLLRKQGKIQILILRLNVILNQHQLSTFLIKIQIYSYILKYFFVLYTHD